jgi:hypothetical protein
MQEIKHGFSIKHWLMTPMVLSQKALSFDSIPALCFQNIKESIKSYVYIFCWNFFQIFQRHP